MPDLHLITRVATRTTTPTVAARGAPMRQEWWDARFPFLRDWTVPSVRAQTDQGFHWSLVMDDDVPAAWVEQTQAMLPSNASILSVPAGTLYKDAVRERLAPAGGDLLTARLDSDDQIAPEFVERVRELARPGWAVNFDVGAVVSIRRRRAGLIRHTSNPFISLWSTEGRTVHDLGRHTNVERRVGVVRPGGRRPMWLQTAETGTTASQTGTAKVLRMRPVAADPLRARFPIPADVRIDDPPSRERVLGALRWFLSR